MPINVPHATCLPLCLISTTSDPASCLTSQHPIPRRPYPQDSIYLHLLYCFLIRESSAKWLCLTRALLKRAWRANVSIDDAVARMTRPKVSPDKRQRTAQACESCKRRKQKVSQIIQVSCCYIDLYESIRRSIPIKIHLILWRDILICRLVSNNLRFLVDDCPSPNILS